VLNVTHECKNYFEENAEYNVIYHRFKIHDNQSEDLLSGIKECLNFIGRLGGSGSDIFSNNLFR